jgi:hypothetical protein
LPAERFPTKKTVFIRAKAALNKIKLQVIQ